MEPEYGSWKIIRRIGKGSFGTVYEIEQVDEFGFSTKSALKVIRIPQSDMQIEELRNEGESEERVAAYFREMAFKVMEEVRLMYHLKGHTNIVGYLDHEIRPCENGISWEILLRMELLTPLRQYTLNNKITRKNVIKLGIDMCNALERCQQFNIIHRDIKPGNILVTDQGDYKLSDFGIAKKVSEDETMASMSQKGTYSYMAPEIYVGEQYGYSVDLYSLGIVMYQLLNYNRDPFLPVYPCPIHHGDHNQALMRRMKGETIPLPAQDNSRLAEIILKACSYNPGDRYSSPRQMKEDLEAILCSDTDLNRFLDGQERSIDVPSSEVSVTASLLRNSNCNVNGQKQVRLDGEEEKTVLLRQNDFGDCWENKKQQDENFQKDIGNLEIIKVEKKKIKFENTIIWKLVLAAVAVFMLSIGGIGVTNYFMSTTVVPNVTNMKEADAREVLRNASLIILRIDQVNSNEIVRGNVIEVENQGKRIRKNSEVVMTISLGAKIIVPDEKGQENGKATEELSELGLLVKTNTDYSEVYAEGQVIEQSIQPNDSVDAGTEIVLTVSLGMKPIKVEDYSGKTVEDIQKKLEEQGVIVKIKKEYSSSVKKGAIISQSVKKGRQVYKGDIITFTVSKGIQQVRVPDITGLTKNSAISKLKETGLKLGSENYDYSDNIEDGKIIVQKVSEGEFVDIGSSVSVTISLGKKQSSSGSGSSSEEGSNSGSGSSSGGGSNSGSGSSSGGGSNSGSGSSSGGESNSGSGNSIGSESGSESQSNSESQSSSDSGNSDDEEVFDDGEADVEN